jgi:hypothetical protein
VQRLDEFVSGSVKPLTGLREFERGLFDQRLEIGRQLTDEFLSPQGDGDLGTWVRLRHSKTQWFIEARRRIRES